MVVVNAKDRHLVHGNNDESKDYDDNKEKYLMRKPRPRDIMKKGKQ